MRITLIYPPSDCLNCECFNLPNLSLPVLAGHLRGLGHEVRMADLDAPFHAGIRPANPDLNFGILKHPEKTADFLRGRLKGPEAGLLRRIGSVLASAPGLEGEAGLYGVTLAGFKMNAFLLNAVGLLAHFLKARGGAPVVVGYNGISREIYRELLEKYPTLDYAVYSGGGPHLARLAEYVEKGPAAGGLFSTLERRGGRIVDHGTGAPDDLSRPDYSGYPLSYYKTTPKELLARYSPDLPFTADLVKKGKGRRQLVVMYRFETSCRGRCAFCGNDGRPPAEQPDADRVVEDLAKLKALGATGVYFINPNFNNRYEFADELCGKMIKRGLDLLWCDCANFRELDAPLLRKMRRAGAVKLTFGMETGSARMLRYIRKGVLPPKIEECLKVSHELGIWNHIELIGGLPTETEDDLNETVSFLRRNAAHIDAFSINPFFLYPTSPFGREPGKFGLRLRRAAPGTRMDLFSAVETPNNFSEKFDEIGGLTFEQKDAQIRRSTRILAETVKEVASERAIDFEHIHLLMYLYSVFGHGRKDLIRRIVGLLTRRFKPYNLDEFLSSVDFRKHDYDRVLREKKEGRG